MRRVHLFEFEDQPWCPAILRNALTAYLRFVVTLTRQTRPVVPALADLLRSSGESQIVDLCSGSGAIARHLRSALAEQGTGVRLVLTDLYPDVDAMRAAADASGGAIEARTVPLDATAVPADLPGVRTIFNAFHHFAPAQAGRVLAAAAEAGRPMAVVEFLDRSPMSLLGVLFSPFLLLAVAPFLRPLRWQVLVLTYLLPVVPAMVLWDGMVSWLRVYSVRELEELAASAAVSGYRWRAGRWSSGPFTVTYLLGQRS
ncbi:MAG TPA: hypothetical protein VEC57_15230 [Candidatus Limnocylindrales bacterium]|nr:hypothetical protein [Candidatus Limnocylindrales bacterium]